MVLIKKTQKKVVYRYLLQQGVIVVHKDFSEMKHKGTKIQNIKVWMMLRSLKDRGFCQLIFNWQYFYYFLNAKGKQYLSQFFGLTEEVVPLTWKKNEARQYEVYEDKGVRRPPRNRDRGEQPYTGGRGSTRRPQQQRVEQKKPPKEEEKGQLPPVQIPEV